MKKVLIISYYWPPAGGPGVQRVLKFARHLSQFGWQPVILTVRNGDYPAIDESLLEKVSPDWRVERTAIAEPYALYRKLTGRKSDEKLPTFVLNEDRRRGVAGKLTSWLRGNIFIPDARIGWIPYAVRAAKKLIREEKVSLVFASSPPHTVQLIARRLAKASGLPWVADFRDPWTEAFWAAELQKSRLSRKLDEHLERGVLREASAVITVSDGLCDMLRRKADNRYEVIQNGFEKTDIPEEPVHRFRILFIGSLSNVQSPETLFRAVATLPEGMQQRVDVVFAGRVYSGWDPLFQEYRHLQIERLAYMPHNELMQYARQAAMLFRPVAQSTYANNNVGAKTYDYLALQRPILTLGVKPSASWRILQETASGELFSYADTAGVRTFIMDWFAHWQKHGTTRLENDALLLPYTSEHQVGKLAKLFDELVECRRDREASGNAGHVKPSNNH